VFCEDCSKYKSLVTSLNYSNINNKRNADAYKAEALAKIDKAVYNLALTDKDRLITEASAATDACVKEKGNVESLSNTYMMVAGAAVLIMIVVVIIWVKYEFLGSRLDDPWTDASKPKRKGWFRKSE
jgi:p-aminobenzoyl-glutamate transporter AbgT